MTVETTLSKKTYLGNGQSTEWPVPFPVAAVEDLRLIVTDEQRREEEVSANKFYVNKIGDFVRSVTYPQSGQPLASGHKLTIYRHTSRKQPVDLTNAGAFHPDTLEKMGFDRVVMMLQEVQEDVDRAIKISIASEEQAVSAEEFYKNINTIADRAEDAAKRAEGYGDCSTLEAGLENLRGSWTSKNALSAGSELELAVNYYVGRNVLVLSMDGLMCYPASPFTDEDVPQYEEVGEDGELSRKVKLLFEAPAGAVWDALVISSNVSAYIESQTKRAEEAVLTIDNAIANAGELAALAAVESVRPTMDAIYAARDEVVAARDISLDAAQIAEGALLAADTATAAAQAAQNAAQQAKEAANAAQGGRNIEHQTAANRPIILAGEAYTVPEYTVGLGDLTIYIDGILCLAGTNPEIHQYYEDGTAGEQSTIIRWHDDIPTHYDITVTT